MSVRWSVISALRAASQSTFANYHGLGAERALRAPEDAPSCHPVWDAWHAAKACLSPTAEIDPATLCSAAATLSEYFQDQQISVIQTGGEADHAMQPAGELLGWDVWDMRWGWSFLTFVEERAKYAACTSLEESHFFVALSACAGCVNEHFLLCSADIARGVAVVMNDAFRGSNPESGKDDGYEVLWVRRVWPTP